MAKRSDSWKRTRMPVAQASGSGGPALSDPRTQSTMRKLVPPRRKRRRSFKYKPREPVWSPAAQAMVTDSQERLPVTTQERTGMANWRLIARWT